AATVMAELRNAARGLAAAGLTPAEILDDLAVVAIFDRQEMFATALYGLLDPDQNILDWALAGHPLPILLRDGRADLIGQDPPGSVFGTPIASGVKGERSEQQLELAEGDLVVFYTDGVVERRFAPIEQGLSRLLRLIEEMAGQSADSLAGRIIEELCSDAADDCSVMVLRRNRI
ncbi:MAG TPA: PP2C family protein-serine/threonine phosphatase, partial [Gemmatimonadales bacterium]